MKKLIAFIILIGLLSSFSLAYGEITVVNYNLVVPNDSDTGKLYAKLQNTGDEIVFADVKGILEAYDNNDNLIYEKNNVNSGHIGLTLNPGEYVYIDDYVYGEKLKNGIAKTEFTVKPREYYKDLDIVEHRFAPLPSQATFEISKDGSNNNFLYVTYTNNTDKILYGVNITAALLDDSDNVLFAESMALETFGIHPNSTLSVKIYLSGEFVENYSDTTQIKADACVRYRLE